jgi:hypothetical protein
MGGMVVSAGAAERAGMSQQLLPAAVEYRRCCASGPTVNRVAGCTVIMGLAGRAPQHWGGLLLGGVTASVFFGRIVLTTGIMMTSLVVWACGWDWQLLWIQCWLAMCCR